MHGMPRAPPAAPRKRHRSNEPRNSSDFVEAAVHCIWQCSGLLSNAAISQVHMPESILPSAPRDPIQGELRKTRYLFVHFSVSEDRFDRHSGINSDLGRSANCGVER